MLTKEEFVQHIELIKKCSELASQLSDALEAMSPGCRCDAFVYSEYEANTIKLLKHVFGLPADNEDIEYFIYDLDYGAKYTPGCFTFKNGKEIDFSSAESVYDYLVTYRLQGATNET